MTIQHKSLRDEILFVIGRSSVPLTSGEIYERCEMVDEMKQVSNALFQLHAAGKVVRIKDDGKLSYALDKGVKTPAPAGKAGRPETAPPADGAGTLRPAPEPGLPALDIPAPGDAPGLNGQPGKAVRRATSDLVADALDQVEAALASSPPPARALPAADPERIADGMLAKLRRDLGSMAPLTGDLDITTAPGSITINVERVEIHINIGVTA